MVPRPPRPTLFPYTTLFRSGTSVAMTTLLPVNPDEVVLAPSGLMLPTLRTPYEVPPMLQVVGKAPPPPPLPTVTDRKSTRLNSSHRCISYAVFCLKKKTQPGPNPPALDPQAAPPDPRPMPAPHPAAVPIDQAIDNGLAYLDKEALNLNPAPPGSVP